MLLSLEHPANIRAAFARAKNFRANQEDEEPKARALADHLISFSFRSLRVLRAFVVLRPVAGTRLAGSRKRYLSVMER